MAIIAGVLGILFGLLHGVQGRAFLLAPAAPRGSGDIGAGPLAARRLWVALALLTIVGITLLAIANGFWMHRRPTLSHHLARVVMAAVVLGVGALAVG